MSVFLEKNVFREKLKTHWLTEKRIVRLDDSHAQIEKITQLFGWTMHFRWKNRTEMILLEKYILPTIDRQVYFLDKKTLSGPQNT